MRLLRINNNLSELCASVAKPLLYKIKKASIVDEMIGRKFIITGMTIEIVSDQNEKWETRNTTTNESIYIDKLVLQNAIKLGKAESVS